jgi:hypothetical protein
VLRTVPVKCFDAKHSRPSTRALKSQFCNFAINSGASSAWRTSTRAKIFKRELYKASSSFQIAMRFVFITSSNSQNGI